MSYRIDPTFLNEMESYGAQDISACFNCGTCTAICPHSEGSDTFPRRLIRYGQLGLKEPLLGSKELWVCYYCGECSDTCPREAEPGEFMAAARRYAIAGNDVTGISRLLYKSPAAAIVAMLVIAVVMALLLLRHAGSLSGRFFEFIPGENVHNVGIGVMVIAIIGIVIGMVNMCRRIAAAIKFQGSSGTRTGGGISAAIGAVVAEVGWQKRYQECASDYSKPEPWYAARWFSHGTMVWGFIGLLFATTWDFLDKLPDGAAVSLLYTPRLVGTIAAILFLYGCTVALVQRLTRSNKYAEHSHLSDWVFILDMFLLAVTGVILLVMAYAAPATAFGNIILLLHIILAFGLILAVPFSKFAHVVYRTLAVFVHAYRGTDAVAISDTRKVA